MFAIGVESCSRVCALDIALAVRVPLRLHSPTALPTTQATLLVSPLHECSLLLV